MGRKKDKADEGRLARSHLMAMAEGLARQGVVKAAVVYITDDGGVGLASTDEISTMEIVFALRQAEHYIFASEESEDESDMEED